MSFLRYSMSRNVVTLKSGSEVTPGHWTWYHSIDWYGFLLAFYSNFVPKMHLFWDIWLVSIQWPWNPGWGSLKVIENYTIQSGTHDFLLTFHSNHRTISHRFRDKRRCPSKIAWKSPIFPPPCLTPPMKGFPLEFGIVVRGPKCLNDGATRWSKKFYDRFSRFDTIPAVTDSHPATFP